MCLRPINPYKRFVWSSVSAQAQHTEPWHAWRRMRWECLFDGVISLNRVCYTQIYKGKTINQEQKEWIIISLGHTVLSIALTDTSHEATEPCSRPDQPVVEAQACTGLLHGLWQKIAANFKKLCTESQLHTCWFCYSFNATSVQR